MKNSKSKLTSNKIIKVTLKLFIRKGYHGTSIADISKAAKLTKGAIYFHFKNKDALLRSILEEYENIFLRKLIQEVESVKGSAVDKYSHFLRLAANFAAKNRQICLCLTSLATELCGSGKKQEQKIKEMYKKYHKFIADLLEEGKKDGSFREDINPNILALNLIGTMEGNLLQWNFNRNQFNNKDFARSYIKFLLTGICRTK